MKPLVSVLVVSYETRDLTLACLASLRDTTVDLELETIVVDNASSDGSARAITEAHPEVRLVAAEENLGFARANNLAAREARGEYLLLLNPDTLVLPGAVQALVACARANPEGGLFGGRTLFEDRSLNPTSCWARMSFWSLFCKGTGLSSVFRGSPLLDPESMGRWPRDTEREVDVVTGCFLLLERALWEELGGFDERFFMYGEDADLSRRAWELGRPCRVTPRATIVHLGGRSERVPAEKSARLFRARCQLLAKHEPAWLARFGCAMHSLWAFSRMAANATLLPLARSRRRSYEAWRDAWRLRGRWSFTSVRASLAAPLDPGAAPLDPGAAPLDPGAAPLDPGAARREDGAPR